MWRIWHANTYGGDAYPYFNLYLRNSPLEKVIKQHNPGRVWRENGRSLKIDEYVNIAGNDTLGCFGFQLINGAREALNISVSKQYEMEACLLHAQRMKMESLCLNLKTVWKEPFWNVV